MAAEMQFLPSWLLSVAEKCMLGPYLLPLHVYTSTSGGSGYEATPSPTHPVTETHPTHHYPHPHHHPYHRCPRPQGEEYRAKLLLIQSCSQYYNVIIIHSPKLWFPSHRYYMVFRVEVNHAAMIFLFPCASVLVFKHVYNNSALTHTCHKLQQNIHYYY